MENIFNKIDDDIWVRPWNEEKFDDIYNRDERFFSIVTKGLISWLNRNILLYNKSINHFIFNTGSSIMYVESNGYEFSWAETTGEDTMYMQLPRCILTINGVNIPMEELSSPFARGNYERKSGNLIRGYNAEIRRMPIDMSINLHYYLGTFNEYIVLLQELIDKIVFQRYFNITYLGQIIRCSIEFATDFNPELNHIDMSSPEPNQKNISIDIKLRTNYPLINERTAIRTDKVIENFGVIHNLENQGYQTDIEKIGKILMNDYDGYNEFIDTINGNDSNNINIKEEEYLEYDYDHDGKIGVSDIKTALEHMKYSKDNEDDYINYNDLIKVIMILKKDNTMYTYDYDQITNKIYIVDGEGEVTEIDLKKYKIEHV
jgi:hypothetical protein